MARHNELVARRLGDVVSAQVWRVVKETYGGVTTVLESTHRKIVDAQCCVRFLVSMGLFAGTKVSGRRNAWPQVREQRSSGPLVEWCGSMATAPGVRRDHAAHLAKKRNTKGRHARASLSSHEPCLCDTLLCPDEEGILHYVEGIETEERIPEAISSPKTSSWRMAQDVWVRRCVNMDARSCRRLQGAAVEQNAFDAVYVVDGLACLLCGRWSNTCGCVKPEGADMSVCGAMLPCGTYTIIGSQAFDTLMSPSPKSSVRHGTSERRAPAGDGALGVSMDIRSGRSTGMRLHKVLESQRKGGKRGRRVHISDRVETVGAAVVGPELGATRLGDEDEDGRMGVDPGDDMSGGSSIEKMESDESERGDVMDGTGDRIGGEVADDDEDTSGCGNGGPVGVVVRVDNSEHPNDEHEATGGIPVLEVTDATRELDHGEHEGAGRMELGPSVMHDVDTALPSVVAAEDVDAGLGGELDVHGYLGDGGVSLCETPMMNDPVGSFDSRGGIDRMLSARNHEVDDGEYTTTSHEGDGGQVADEARDVLHDARHDQKDESFTGSASVQDDIGGIGSFQTGDHGGGSTLSLGHSVGADCSASFDPFRAGRGHGDSGDFGPGRARTISTRVASSSRSGFMDTSMSEDGSVQQGDSAAGGSTVPSVQQLHSGTFGATVPSSCDVVRRGASVPEHVAHSDTSVCSASELVVAAPSRMCVPPLIGVVDDGSLLDQARLMDTFFSGSVAAHVPWATGMVGVSCPYMSRTLEPTNVRESGELGTNMLSTSAHGTAHEVKGFFSAFVAEGWGQAVRTRLQPGGDVRAPDGVSDVDGAATTLDIRGGTCGTPQSTELVKGTSEMEGHQYFDIGVLDHVFQYVARELGDVQLSMFLVIVLQVLNPMSSFGDVIPTRWWVFEHAKEWFKRVPMAVVCAWHGCRGGTDASSSRSIHSGCERRRL